MSILIPKNRKLPNIKVAKDKRKQNHSTEARHVYMKGFLENRTFPDDMKREAVELIQAHFKLLDNTLAAIELTHLRNTQHYV